ncbi:DUF2721 domain-containing protein [Parvularcula sp. LCG005]|uniref:DUF2721 domain-containing protein n=1 Tax=Parvularcula sp. LCG005 TaxID=3078805 RepID=UPI0029432CE2|nr:DUF2721 domain-containing protein [Parvularcula sp. LCG005]WOI53151.1 DUF2721 domain-containing protein [Parvularcula sp. LCG005]
MDLISTEETAHAIGLVIQLAIAPIFLLVGTGSFLNVMTVRLGRVVDRVRILEERLDRGETGDERRRHVDELRILDRRMSYANRAISFCSSSALLISIVVAMLFLGELTDWPMRFVVAPLFVITMLSLIAGLTQFLCEITLATRSLRVRTELMQQNDAD